jgi:alpha-D-xyloside xylohydrolase
MQKLTTGMFRQRNERTYGLVRASNAGASSLPYVIYNDYYSHEDFITALCNSGFSGILWTPEVRQSKTSEEWLRRMQSVCFSPMAMINAWASGTKPWSYPEVEKEVKAIADLRMALMPYFYSEFAKYHFDGTPPFRAMYLEPGFSMVPEEQKNTAGLNDNPYAEAIRKEIKDQYMAGENLLIAPLFTGQTSRKVVLPRGKWFDFYTGAYAGDGEVISVEPGLDHIPVFVKDGALVPLMKPRLRAPKASEKVDLEIRHYGTKNGAYELYDDDGETFDYEKGAYSWRKLTVERLQNGKSKTSISPAEKGKPDAIGKLTWIEMTDRP